MTEFDIRPGTERWYNYDAATYIEIAKEAIEEWDYDEDPHGYCHSRSVLVGLLREIERLA